MEVVARRRRQRLRQGRRHRLRRRRLRRRRLRRPLILAPTYMHRRRRSVLRRRHRLVARRSWGACVPRGRTYSAAGSVRPASGSEIAGRVPPASTADSCIAPLPCSAMFSLYTALTASTEASSEHAESQGALTAPARDSARAEAQPLCPVSRARSQSLAQLPSFDALFENWGLALLFLNDQNKWFEGSQNSLPET